MMQEINKDYIAAILALPNGLDRIVMMIVGQVVQRDGARKAERDAIVAWLMDAADDCPPGIDKFVRGLAAAIEKAT